jgi:Mg-chelatase subunit ChlD
VLTAACLWVSASGLVGACSSEEGSGDEGSNAGSSGSSKGGSTSGGSQNEGGAAAESGASSSTGGSLGGTGGKGGSTSDAGNDGEGGEVACATTREEAKLAPANLLFVIDKSGSMNCNPPEGDEALNARCANFPVKEDPSLPSKWEVTTDALSNALDTLSMQPNVRVGMNLFPRDSSCAVEAEPNVDVAALDSTQRTDLGAVLDETTPAGETPIAGATILSYAHLSEALREGELDGNIFVVLLTDGAETCKESELPKLLAEDVPNARLFNIRTFVIGAPGSENARSLLSQMAFAGGTARSGGCNHSDAQPDEGDCHFDMTTSADFAADLDAALQEISRTKVLSCEFEVPENPDGGGVDLAKVNVTFQPGDGGMVEEIVKDTSAECDEAAGWQYSDDSSKIVLCGEVCDRVQADAEGQVRIVLGCPTIEVK